MFSSQFAILIMHGLGALEAKKDEDGDDEQDVFQERVKSGEGIP